MDEEINFLVLSIISIAFILFGGIIIKVQDPIVGKITLFLGLLLSICCVGHYIQMMDELESNYDGVVGNGRR